VHKVAIQVCILTEDGEFKEFRIRTGWESLTETFGGRVLARMTRMNALKTCRSAGRTAIPTAMVAKRSQQASAWSASEPADSSARRAGASGAAPVSRATEQTRPRPVAETHNSGPAGADVPSQTGAASFVSRQ
jgi:hypothetical protein